MNFHRAEPNGNFRALRLLSDGGRWELGLSPYSHGMRLRMGLAGRPPQVMDFCLGRDVSLFPKVLVAVLRRLEPLDEPSPPEMIDAAFPWVGTRPDLALHLAELLDPVGSQLPVREHQAGRTSHQPALHRTLRST